MANFLERIAAGLSRRSIDSENPEFFNRLFDEQLDAGTGRTWAGKIVNPETAVSGVVAVYACVSLLSETVGSLPLHLNKRVSDKERKRITPTRTRFPGSLARLLAESPNPEMTAQEFWELAEAHIDLWGNFYANVQRSGDGRPSALWPLRPDQMEVVRFTGGRRGYVYQLPNGEKRALTRSEVMHAKGFGYHPDVGISPVGVARQAIGINVAAEEYAGRFFSNSAIPGGLLTTEEKPPKDTQKQKDWTQAIRDAWKGTVGGLNNAQRIAVLHSGMDYKAVGIPPKDAQFLETRRWQLQDIARMFGRIPPHMIGDTERSTSWGTGIEQQSIGFVVYTIRPRITRFEGAINRDLRDPEAGRTLADESIYAQFEVKGLLRGDMAARGEFYQKLWSMTAITGEDIRALEDLPYIPGLDRHFLGSGVMPMPKEGEEIAPPAPPDPPDEPEPPRTARQAYTAHLAALDAPRNLGTDEDATP